MQNIAKQERILWSDWKFCNIGFYKRNVIVFKVSVFGDIDLTAIIINPCNYSFTGSKHKHVRDITITTTQIKNVPFSWQKSTIAVEIVFKDHFNPEIPLKDRPFKR